MTRRVLVVSPLFPPVNAPDMQRVRMSLPHFREFGWDPWVLAVAPADGDAIEPLLNDTVPDDVPVTRVRALPARLARLVGVGNLALRALPSLHRAGSRIIERAPIDLVYFSTTMFLSMPLGRVWKRRLATPFVLDMQDPWLSDYYDTHPEAQAPPKYGLARRLHAVLEPWTMNAVDGIVAVSQAYIDTLRRRYPRLDEVPCSALPFGASASDFRLLDRRPQPNRHFARGDGRLHGVYAGRGGDDLATALDILFRALQGGRAARPDLFARVLLHFVGTDYASDDRARKTIEPVARRAGVEAQVAETTTRAPYFEALQLLRDADFLLVVGSDDPAYSASKVYPYILARKPLFAIVHQDSPLVRVLRDTRAGVVVTFPSAPSEDQRAGAARELQARWTAALADPGGEPPTDWDAFEPYTAREMTRRQCALFDAVLAHHAPS